MVRLPSSRPPLCPAEQRAIDALSRQFRPSLTRYFGKRCKETSEIEDLVQEVFLRLAKRSAVTDVEKVSAYVFQTASSVLNDWLRRSKVRHLQDHHGFDEEYLQDELDGQGGVDFAPDRVLIGRKRLAEAIAILMELPERTRTVFILRRIEGLRYKAIAARLGISVSAVERHVQRAVLHLMTRLEDE